MNVIVADIDWYKFWLNEKVRFEVNEYSLTMNNTVV